VQAKPCAQAALPRHRECTRTATASDGCPLPGTAPLTAAIETGVHSACALHVAALRLGLPQMHAAISSLRPLC
jgi:hypothetical protein